MIRFEYFIELALLDLLKALTNLVKISTRYIDERTLEK